MAINTQKLIMHTYQLITNSNNINLCKNAIVIGLYRMYS